MNKYILTDISKTIFGIKLFQIKALISFGDVKEGDLGGWIEKEENLSRVYGDAWVYGDARVSGDAWVSGDARVSVKASFTLGWFIGGDNTGKITDITKQTGSDYWKNQYVLGDYKIEPIEEEAKESTDIEKAIELLTREGKIKDGKILI